MTIELPPICTGCVHYIERRRCKAFPQGIPDDIIHNRFDHRQPHPQDGGIHFEPVDQRAATVAALYFDTWRLDKTAATTKAGSVPFTRDGGAWDEDQHPRDSHGRFAPGGGSANDASASGNASGETAGGYTRAKYEGDTGIQHFDTYRQQAVALVDKFYDPNLPVPEEAEHYQTAFEKAGDSIPDTAQGRAEGHPDLYAICQEQGFNGPATLVSEDGLQEAIKNGDIELWRGVTRDSFAEGYAHGPNYAGSGVYGNGTYAAHDSGSQDAEGHFVYSAHDVAVSYTRGENYDGTTRYGPVIHMALDKNARVVDAETLENQAYALISKFPGGYSPTTTKESLEARVSSSYYSDLGKLAASQGYDAIRQKDAASRGTDFYVILNRTAVKMSTEVREHDGSTKNI